MSGKKRLAAHASEERSQGTALVMVLIALLVLSVLGLYLALMATAEVRISDNFESFHRARSAALAGISHARMLLRGIRFDDLLMGPDGTHNVTPLYVASARTYAFRMPLAWSLARTLDIETPGSALAGLSDDGEINTGHHSGGNGLALIPLDGIAHAVANPNGPGNLVTARYFVKVSDNNGDASELASDPSDDPFTDGDGQIIVRSMGLARTLAAAPITGSFGNSVVTFEARFKRLSTFVLDAAVVVVSSAVMPAEATMFSGTGFLIQGGPGAPGIAVIDSSVQDGIAPDQEILSALAPGQGALVQGAGMAPSIRDITVPISADADKRLLLDSSFLWRLLSQSAPKFADNVFVGAQSWIGAAPVPLGHYNPAFPPGAPGQDPRAIHVDGDLLVDGSLEGGGLLIVTGRMRIRGQFVFNGLILTLGAGEIDVGGDSVIAGGICAAGISNISGSLSWVNAKISVGGNSRIIFDREAIRTAVSLIPPLQLGCREITPIIDP